MSDHLDVLQRGIGEPELGGFFGCLPIFWSWSVGSLDWFHCCFLWQLQLVFWGIQVGSGLFYCCMLGGQVRDRDRLPAED